MTIDQYGSYAFLVTGLVLACAALVARMMRGA